MASNSTIIFRWKLVISTEYIILSSGIAMALSQSNGFTELHGLDTILFYRKFRGHGSFTEPWLYRTACTRYYSVLQKVSEEKPFEHVGFPRAHSGCGDFLANVYFGKVELFLGYFFFLASSWIANSHPDMEPQGLAALSGHNKVSALSDSLVPCPILIPNKKL